MMLNAEKSVLVIIDVQGRLADVMQEPAAMFANINRLGRTANALEIPIILTEQLPDKLGPTRPEAVDQLKIPAAIAKSAFSCCGESEFTDTLNRFKKTQVILCGIESHICVLQTALELRDQGYEVFLVADAASSRNPEHKALAMERMRKHGVEIIVAEMAMFEWMRDAKHPAFRVVRTFLA